MSLEVTGLLRYPESILQTPGISFCSSDKSSPKLIRDWFKLGTVEFTNIMYVSTSLV
jgi:hypothetical protein